jgi:uncharacterized protein YkwD
MQFLGVVAAALALSSAPAVHTASTGALAPRSVCRGQSAIAAPAAVQLHALRCLINWARRHGGEGALHRSAELDRSASMRADDIHRCQDFSHTPCGQPFIAVFEVVGYFTGTAAVGENLAWGQGSLGTARSAMRSWLASPAHRQILFTSNWQDLGVARVHAPSLFGYANVTLWVAQFGHHVGLAPVP